jgi:putative thioredoxin
MPGTWVIEATDRDFETAVLERSRQVPVVVDFWAEWCGPCRTLGPLLERLADEYEGQFVLAKVDVDANPGLAQSFGVQSIPMVLAFRDAQVVRHFVGALPESGLRQFLAAVLPSEADRLAAEGDAALAAGRTDEAEGRFRAALQLDPRHGAALIGSAEILATAGREDEALALLDRVDPGPHRARAEQSAARIRVGHSGGAADTEGLRSQVDTAPDDVDLRFRVAQAYAAAGRHEDALRHYLEVVSRDRAYGEDAARRAMVDLFSLLGSDHPLTDRYRSELGKVLFR